MVSPNSAGRAEASVQRKICLIRALLIIAAATWVFAPALHGDWLMDDDLYVTQNPLHGDPAALWKVWFSPGSFIEYYPVEASVQFFEWRLWGLDPFGYHVVNLVLHIASALLVWRLLAKFGLKLAWIGGLLFAIHPAVVESVAWISELKNTLSLPPFLLAMAAWMDYASRGRRTDYVFALALFLLAMLCKISMAAFPIVILLYAWWLHGRLRWRDWRESAPFFLISIVLGLATVWAGSAFRHAHLQSADNPSIGDALTRFALAGTTLAFYFAKAVLPFDMTPIYPKWPVDAYALETYLPWLAIVALASWCWMRRATWGRHALLGLGFFAVNLVPFLGFTSVSYMAFTWVMDHFLYLPLIGIIGLVIAVLDCFAISSSRWPFAAPAVIALIVAALAWESSTYAAVFAGPERLWTYTIARNSTSWLAYNNLGNILLETGRTAEAIQRYHQALVLNPAMVEAHTNLGRAYVEEGRLPEAIAEYEAALKYNPHFGVALVNLGDALALEGQNKDALGTYAEAIKVNPDDKATRDKAAKLRATIATP
jgi:tetratricopeptide (TPR) repeat protein